MLPQSLEFHPILDPEVSIIGKTRRAQITWGKHGWMSTQRDRLRLSPFESAWFAFHSRGSLANSQSLIPVTLTTNRAPVKTAWAYTVARRLGFDLQEALSIAHVYVHFSSLKHALKLGNILNAQETKDAEEEIMELPGQEKDPSTGNKGKGRMWGNAKEGVRGQSSQPWVGILRARM